MAKINVRNEVREYPDNSAAGYNTLIVRNHWNYRDRVVLEINGKEYTFLAEHLKAAISNATNAH